MCARCRTELLSLARCFCHQGIGYLKDLPNLKRNTVFSVDLVLLSIDASLQWFLCVFRNQSVACRLINLKESNTMLQFEWQIVDEKHEIPFS